MTLVIKNFEKMIVKNYLKSPSVSYVHLGSICTRNKTNLINRDQISKEDPYSTSHLVALVYRF